MCTVTYIRSNQHYFLTSSRDEKVTRGQALIPEVYDHHGARMLYPKDKDADGTWVALKENRSAAVLLNGAFEKHASKPPYRRSRGLILLEILAASAQLDKFLKIPLLNIEPFTVILFANDQLHELRWDGNQKHTELLNPQQNYIWSSATLYDPSIRKQRENWFQDWQANHPHPSLSSIILFHQLAGNGNNENNVCMNRGGTLLTVSITGIELSNASTGMHYLDLLNGSRHVSVLPQPRPVIL